MRDSASWAYRLDAMERRELLAAASASESSGVPLTNLGRADFPLPTLGPVLDDFARELVNGRGFFLLRRIPVDEPRATVARVLLGVGAYLGEPVSQNAAGHLLGHIKDLGDDPSLPTTRVYTTNHRHLFHTDSCDIVGLLCLQKSMRGGESAIASSTAIYNELAQTRPDLARVLAEPFVVDRKGEIPEGKGPTYEMPIFHHFAGFLTTFYSRDFITVAQARPEVPRLTEKQLEAMDLIDTLASSEKFRLDMAFEPGDAQWLHNHQILHARRAYEDFPEPERKRHLLRLWLSAREGRPLPEVFSERYGEIRVGRRRGGIFVPGATLSAPLEAEAST